jgi:XTP/dITP diphosphohydrolase
MGSLGPVVIATKNPDKLREMRAVLIAAVPGIEIVEDAVWADVAETGDTLRDNALLKGSAVAGETGLVAIADDTGLEVKALGGAPGVRTARLAGPNASYAENRRALLGLLGESRERGARFRTVISVVWPDGESCTVEGVLEGRIAYRERGSGGFGYDSIFELPDGRTLAEVVEEEKNSMSHRARALHALAARLGEADGGAC